MNLSITITIGHRRSYRAPHDPERVNVNGDDLRYIPNVDPTLRGSVRAVVVTKHTSLPEVYRFQPFHSVLLTEPLQWIVRKINPELSDEKFRTLLTDNLMLTNGTGFGDQNGPRADYINRRDLDAKPPAFDQIRFMGGAKFREKRIEGSRLYVEYVDAHDPPSPEFVFDHDYLWYWGTGIRPDGGVNYIQRLGMDGTMKRIRLPIIASQDIYVDLSDVHLVSLGSVFPEANWQFFYDQLRPT